MVGSLPWTSVASRLDLVAPPVATALAALDGDVQVAEIDPSLADTEAFCKAYDIGLEISANCVVVAAKRGGSRTFAACVILATTRADVNGLVRRHLDARKVSFAPMDAAVAESGMEYGGITPVGLPATWPLLVDEAATKPDLVVVGSGLRKSKLLLPAELLPRLPAAEVLPDLAHPI